jgi:DNA-binding transcriptional regulator YdaS (Cro superfamily)
LLIIGVMKETAARRASEKLGGAARLAEVAGVSIQAAYQWINGDRPVPAERAPLIAAASGVPVEELCPAVPWHLVTDPEDPAPQQAAFHARKAQMS